MLNSSYLASCLYTHWRRRRRLLQFDGLWLGITSDFQYLLPWQRNLIFQWS